MTWRRQFTKKRLVVFVVALILYGGLWLLTQMIGAPKVHAIVVEAMHLPPNYTDVSQGTGRVTEPSYYCFSSADGPFLVRADYGWEGGPLLYGDGGSALYLWLLGRTFRILELEHWMA